MTTDLEARLREICLGVDPCAQDVRPLVLLERLVDFQRELMEQSGSLDTTALSRVTMLLKLADDMVRDLLTIDRHRRLEA